MKRTLIAGALALLLASANAATTTTSVTLSATSYTDLGVGPIYIGAGGGPVVYKLADSQPADSSLGVGAVYPGTPALLLSTTSHIWALAATAGATAIVSAGTGITVSGGGGGGGSVTQGTDPWNVFLTNANANGQATMANSSPVAIASNQSAVPVSLASLPAFAATPTFNLGTIGTAATAANQATEITNLGTIGTNTGLLATDAHLTRQQGVIGAATSPVEMSLGGGVYNSSPLTLTTGQSAALQADVNGYLDVDVKNINANGQTTSANSSPVVIASDQSAVAVKVASGAIASGAVASGAIASGAFASGSISANAAASGAFPAGAITDLAHGQGAMAASVPVAIASDQSALTLKAATTGGETTTGNIAANNTTAVVVKASAGTLYGVQLYGIGSAPAYLKIYNATSATCGSGTPVKRLMIPAASTAANGAGSNISFGAQGVAFGTGITYCVTTGITDADTTAPAASTFLINLDWN